MKEITKEEYYNKVYGSWLGRISGDFVGYPLEFHPYKFIVKKYGNDLDYYPKEINLDYVNDDEMYEIVALIAFEKYGLDLTAKEISQEWLNLLYKKNFTAEAIALKNLRKGIWPPESATYNNIWYDAIGAQMRADIFGQIAPGCPDIAKYYAEIDGSISHSGIGIEGEVYIAVMLSNAFFETDIRKNIHYSLNYILSATESIYAEMILKAIDIYEKNEDNFRDARDELINYWHYIRKKKIKSKDRFMGKRRVKFLNKYISAVHVLPNIGIIILSLLYGAENEKDTLGKSICTAAMMGLDTDCNCGNIGAIIGAQLGADKIPSKWKAPLRNSFSTYVKGYEKWKITDLAKRIWNMGLKVVEQKGKNCVRIN